jgi:hypothetical protein
VSLDRKVLSDKVICEQRPERSDGKSQADMWRRALKTEKKSKCNAPEVGRC